MNSKLILLLTLLLPLVYAAPTLELQTEEIQPGETILATITTSGEFTKEIELSQIKFFEGRKEINLKTDINFHNYTHYLSIQTSREQNITLQIENILYKEDDTLQSSTIRKNLTIKTQEFTGENGTYTQILKISPGIIFTASNPLLKLTNLGSKDLEVEFEENKIQIPSHSTHDLEFTPSSPFSLTKISSYKDFIIPTFYLGAQENITLISPSIKSALRPEQDLISLELFTENKTEIEISLFNFADENLTNIISSHNTSFLELSIPKESMQAHEVQNMSLIFSPEIAGRFQDTIKISYEINETQESFEIPLDILILPAGTPEENFEAEEETCEELFGIVCSSGTICNGTSTFTKNLEYCCLASCVEIQEETSSSSSSSGWIIGIIIIIILAGIGYYFYQKQKETLSPTPEQTLKSAGEKLEKRYTREPSTRTQGNLTKS